MARNQPLSSKNPSDSESLSQPRQHTLSSNNSGASIIQQQYQSHFSTNSRFTTTRPKNPTDGASSSISSKNSVESSGSRKAFVPMLDLKKIAMAKYQKEVTPASGVSQKLSEQQQESNAAPKETKLY